MERGSDGSSGDIEVRGAAEKTEKMDCFVFGALISRLFRNSCKEAIKSFF